MKYKLLVEKKGQLSYIDVEHRHNHHSITLTYRIDDEDHDVTEEITEYALEDLIAELKDEYCVHCCFTCRFGNFCPMGDLDNEIFCVKDEDVKCKEDICDILEKESEREKRVRSLFDTCSDFEPYSQDYFSYR